MKTVMTLKETCEFYNGTGFPTAYQGKTAGKYPFYKVGDISRNVQIGNSYLQECDNYVNDETLSQLRGVIVPANSIAFAKIGEALKLNRRTITSTPCLVDNNVIAIHPNEEILDVEYFYYFMKTVNMADYSSSTTVPSVKKSSLEKIVVPTPELNEQKRISSELNTLSVAIRSKKDELYSLDELVKSRFIEMFGDCKKITLQKFCKFQQGTQVPIELQSEQQKDGYLRFLRIIDYTQAPQIPRYVNVKGKIVDEQSVVVVRYGASAGFVGKGYSGILANNLFEIIPDESIMSKYFLYCALKYGNFESEISKKCAGVAMPALSFGIMKDMEIYNPLIELQNEFAEFVKLIDKSKFIVQQQIKDLQELLDSKMDEYFR